MANGTRLPSDFPHKVQAETRRFLEEVVAENRRLHGLVVALRSERLLLEEQAMALRGELDRQRREQVQLQQELAEFESRDERLTERFAKIEQQNANLANLYVASYQLHGTLNQRVVLDTIQEVIANLVGSEEMAVFELDSQSGKLKLATSFGIERMAFPCIPLGQGLIGRVAQSGASFIAGESSREGARPEEETLTACVPLKLEDRVTGAIAVFRLLPQKKRGIEALDRELFDLLAVHAAMALYCTSLHARQQ